MFPEEKILREVIKLQEKIDTLHFDIKLVKKNNLNMGDKRILDVFDVALFLSEQPPYYTSRHRRQVEKFQIRQKETVRTERNPRLP